MTPPNSVGLLALLAVGLGDVVAVVGARIGHQADALEDAGVVEQGAGDHRKRHLMGAGPARDLAVIVVGTGDVFDFVVVLEIDLMQAVGLGRTALEIGPAGERRARRAAIGAAGEGLEFLRRAAAPIPARRARGPRWWNDAAPPPRRRPPRSTPASPASALPQGAWTHPFSALIVARMAACANLAVDRVTSRR